MMVSVLCVLFGMLFTFVNIVGSFSRRVGFAAKMAVVTLSMFAFLVGAALGPVGA